MVGYQLDDDSQAFTNRKWLDLTISIHLKMVGVPGINENPSLGRCLSIAIHMSGAGSI